MAARILSLLSSAVPATPRLARGLSTSAPSPVDQFIAYALRQCKGKHDEAVDILRTGLTTPGISGLDCTRLHLSCGEVQLDAIRLRDAQSSAAAAASALPEASPSPQSEPLRLAASMLSVRALLSTGGRGDDAAACEEAAAAVLRACGSGASAAAAAGAHALLLGTALATGAPSALFGPAQAAVRGALAAEAASGTGGGAGDAARLHHALGGWLFAHGDADGARAHFDSAASAATVARADAARAACPATFEGAWAEVEADALLSLAQVDVAREEWAGAEEVLGRALKAAEEVSTEQHPRLAPVLLCLGKVYARTARVVFAEGLYRECAKLVRLEPGRPEVGAGVRAHASLAAVIAWQYHQLMTALPNRGGDLSAWEACARALWANAGAVSRGADIEQVLGASAHLTGKGGPGSGVLVSLALRRALPGSLPQPPQ